MSSLVPYSILGLSFNVEEVEERCADGSLIDFPGTASEEDETKLAAKLELLQNNKHLMKSLVGNIFLKLLVYHHTHSGDSDKRVTKRHTSSSANLAIFLRNKLKYVPKWMTIPLACPGKRSSRLGQMICTCV